MLYRSEVQGLVRRRGKPSRRRRRAVIDAQFNTTDVCIVVKTDLVTEKYFKHYERTAGPGREE
jgi:hypothetical protein